MIPRRVVFSTKHFTWLHIPKTGGTWLHEVMSQNAPASWEVSAGAPAHVVLEEVPTALEHWNRHPERVGLPIVGAVRNPWDWYVSAYFFLEQHRVNRTGGFAVPKSQWTRDLLDFEELYTRGNDTRGFRLALPRLLEAMHVTTLWRSMPPQRRFLRNADGTLGVTVVRFENLRQGTLDTFESLGAEITPQLRSAIMESPKTNTSGHAAYRDCYDDMTRKLVEQYDGWLIDTFEYRF